MRYYKLLYDYENDEKFISCNEGDIGDMDEYLVGDGDKLDSWADNIIFDYELEEGKELPDYLGNPYRWFLVSNKFKELMDMYLDKAVQYLPVVIRDEKGNIAESSYQVANVINAIEALDLEKSECDYLELDDQKILTVDRYVLKESALRESHILKLKEDTLPIFVSESVKNLVEENNMLGFGFLEVEVV